MTPTPSRETSRGATPDPHVTRTPLFLFATGIENSYPTIQNGRVRRDQMEECGHYRLWERDFALVEELGIRFLRYGPPLHKTFLGQGRYEWDFADVTFASLKAREIVPIVDLCHFGVPDWIGDFQNPDFPALFAEYARAFAQRFPWVQLYTPVNEMFVCATFSAATGYWNEQLKSDMCGRPLRSKRNLEERCGPWSGADMCATFDAARSMPRAQMGVRGSGPIQAHALEALVVKLVFLIRSLDRCAIPLL